MRPAPPAFVGANIAGPGSDLRRLSFAGKRRRTTGATGCRRWTVRRPAHGQGEQQPDRGTLPELLLQQCLTTYPAWAHRTITIHQWHHDRHLKHHTFPGPCHGGVQRGTLSADTGREGGVLLIVAGDQSPIAHAKCRSHKELGIWSVRLHGGSAGQLHQGAITRVKVIHAGMAQVLELKGDGVCHGRNVGQDSPHASTIAHTMRPSHVDG
jgi:hypothetical protein